MKPIADPRTKNTQRLRGRRRGLAPLELVLALPLLLMVMALMVVFGNAAFWKVRGLTVARHAAWNDRWPRHGENDPPPRLWPQPGTMQLGGGPDIDVLDDPFVRHPVARGTLPQIVVDADLLDPSRGVIEGTAEITRRPPMLPELGTIRYDLNHPLLDDKFQYAQMGIRANRFRRTPVLYELPKADAALSQAFAANVRTLVGAPFRDDLRTLDRDEELHDWYGHYIDFHPRVAGFCEIDPASVTEDVQDLIDNVQGSPGPPRVPGVPEVMASTFLGMYQEQLQGLQDQIDQLAMSTDPAAAAQIGQLMQQMDQIQPHIQQLQSFLMSLRSM